VVCSLCGYTCPTKRGLAIHMGKAHKEHQAQQECKHCGKKRTEFSRTDKFTEHCRQCEAKQNENVPNQPRCQPVSTEKADAVLTHGSLDQPHSNVLSGQNCEL